MLSMDPPCVESKGRVRVVGMRMGYGFEACDEKVSSLTAHSGARALRCATRQCASSKRFTHYKPCLLRRLLHLGVQQTFEVLHEEDHPVGAADRDVEAIPAVRVVGDPAHRGRPRAELQPVGRVVDVVHARRRFRHHPENENERRLDPLKTVEIRR